MNIGKALQDKREESNLTQSKLAKETNLGQQNISRWENGKHVPDIIDCIVLADYYGVSLDELVGREEYGKVLDEGIGLSPQERQLVDCFRSLSDDGKTAFISMAQNLADMYRRAVKIS